VRLRQSKWFSGLVCSLAFVGCVAEEDQGEGENTGVVKDELLLADSPWPGRQVDVCWEPASMLRADFAVRKEQVRAAALRWTQATGLRFAGWDSACPSIPDRVISINLRDIEGGITTPIGFDPDLPTVLTLGVNDASFLDMTAHEFGHALGFWHEFFRSDFPNDPQCVAPVIRQVGNTQSTPPDPLSLMLHSYCGNRRGLSYFDTVGARNTYGFSNFFADVNGDRKADTILVDRNGISVVTSTGVALPVGNVQSWLAGSFRGTKGNFFADVNGDGMADAIAMEDNGIRVALSTGIAFAAPTFWASSALHGSRSSHFADVNGDGKADAIAVNNNGVHIALSTGAAFDVAGRKNWTGGFVLDGEYGVYFADMTGDGKADAIHIRKDFIAVAKNTGNGFNVNPMSTYFLGLFRGELGQGFWDVNGDGKADAVKIDTDGVWVLRNTGAALTGLTRWTTARLMGEHGTFFADTSGDGKADVIAVNPAGVEVGLSSGTAFAATTNWSGSLLISAADECATEAGSSSYCSTTCPCAENDGDCDSTSQCLPGLVCASNQGAAFGMTPDSDVCVEAVCSGRSVGSDTFCNAACPCGLGGGNCTSDADCLTGYQCANDYGPMFKQAPTSNICVPFSCMNRTPGGGSFCSAACPCGVGGGDCDNDSQCMPGLICASNVGESYGMTPSSDVCIVPSCEGRVEGSGTFCSAACPCGVGGGDCDSSAECLPGLRCASNNGAQFGYSKDTDVCVP
jgi:hypothetical protein